MKKKFSLKKLIILLFIYLYAQYNIRSNSLYYAKHTPHSEEVDPEIMMLIKNWYWIYVPTPEGYSKRGILNGISYGFYDLDEDIFENIYSYEKEKYIFSEKRVDKKYIYYFNKKVYQVSEYEDGKLISRKKGILADKIAKNRGIYNKVRKLIKPILDANSEPSLINLQWLFDMKYEDYLN